MTNSKKVKLLAVAEALVNVVIGNVLAVLSQIFIFPIIGIEIGLAESVGISIYFTVLALVRMYFVRLGFSNLGKRDAKTQN